MSNQINNGGPAFPQWDGHAITSEPLHLRGGMSLRDWFAGMALQGLLANGERTANMMASAVPHEVAVNATVKLAIGMADSMLAERTNAKR